MREKRNSVQRARAGSVTAKKQTDRKADPQRGERGLAWMLLDITGRIVADFTPALTGLTHHTSTDLFEVFGIERVFDLPGFGFSGGTQFLRRIQDVVSGRHSRGGGVCHRKGRSRCEVEFKPRYAFLAHVSVRSAMECKHSALASCHDAWLKASRRAGPRCVSPFPLPPGMSADSEDLPYYIHQSGIHERGIFAARDIKKGERVIEYLGEKISKAESERRGQEQMAKAARNGGGAVYIFILNKKFDVDGDKEWNPARLVNHSCSPNCETQIIRGRIWTVALRNIPKDTELSYDYGFDLETWEEHPCRCGAPNCRGYIVGKDYAARLKKLIAKRDAELTASLPKEKPAAAGKKKAKSGKAAVPVKAAKKGTSLPAKAAQKEKKAASKKR